MIEKTYFEDIKSFNTHKKYWKDGPYHKYNITQPAKFPCVAIEYSESHGDLGTRTYVDEYVYLSDFGKE